MALFGECEFKPPDNYRRLPLRIASLRRRIQRPSYVPVDYEGERIPRGKYLSGASTAAPQQRRNVGFIPLKGDSPSFTLPDVHSGPHSPRDDTRLKTAAPGVTLSCPNSPLTGSRPGIVATSLPSTDVSVSLLPICLTSDYETSKHNLQWLDIEHSGMSTPDLDIMKVELSPRLNSSQSDTASTDYTITTSYPRNKAKENTTSDTVSKRLDVDSRLLDTRNTAARRVFVGTCQLLGIPVSQSLYRSLELSAINLKYHILSEPQFKAFAVGLAKTSTVKSLNLCGTGMTDRSFYYLCDVLHVNYTVTQLSASDNKLTSLSAQRLQEIMDDNGTIESLDLSGNSFKDSDAVYFAEIIKINSALNKLYLNHNLFGAEAGYHIGRAVGLNEDLTTLDLSWNQFRKDGAWQLISQISFNVHLKELDLSWNGLGMEGCDGLSEFLKVNTTLSSLDITSNRITQDAFRVLVKGLVKNSSLHTLKVGRNPITQAGVFEFLAKLKSLELSGISALPSLNIIDFSNIIVLRKVVTLQESLQRSYPHLQFVFGSVSHESGILAVAKQQHYTKLTSVQAKTVLLEMLKEAGLDPEHILPKNKAVEWQICEVKSAIQALSIPLTDGAIDLVLRRIASNGVIIPSDILNPKPKKIPSYVSHSHKH